MTISRAHDQITPADVAALGLVNLEFRYVGIELADAVRGENSCDLWMVTIWADGRIESDPHCDDSVAEDGNGPLEGIGGEYATGGTFSYLEDDHDLSDRYAALMSGKAAQTV